MAHISEHFLLSINCFIKFRTTTDLAGGDEVVILTLSRVIAIFSSRLRIIWDLPLTQVQGITVEDTGIHFASKAGKDQDRFVVIQDKKSQTWFFNQVASVVKTFNANRRLER